MVLEISAKTVAHVVLKGKPPSNSGYCCGKSTGYRKC